MFSDYYYDGTNWYYKKVGLGCPEEQQVFTVFPRIKIQNIKKFYKKIQETKDKLKKHKLCTQKQGRSSRFYFFY